MDGGGPVSGHRSRHRETRDLMPELQCHAVPGEQPRCQQFVDRRRRAARDGIKQRDLDPGTDQRRRIQYRTRGSAQPRRPGQHRIPGRGRHVARPRLHGLADVKRVAAGQPVQRGGVEAASAGQHRHRFRRQRREADAPDAPIGGQVAEGQAEQVRRAQTFVPVGGQQQDRHVPDPPAEETQQVDGGLVGPVDVLHDQHVQLARLADLSQQRAEQLLARGLGAAQLQQLAAEPTGDVVERAERPRGEQAVAGSPVPGGLGQVVFCPLDQCRLADARLAGDEHQPAIPAPRLLRVLR